MLFTDVKIGWSWSVGVSWRADYEGTSGCTGAHGGIA